MLSACVESKHLKPPRQSVSRSHARLRRDESGVWLVEDLGSRNGTYLNDLPAKKSVLAFGDKLRVGSAVLVVSRYNPVEQRLRQQQRLETLGRLATGVTHDLNNMQQAVATSVAFLQSLPPDASFADPTVRECLVDLAAASARSSELAACLPGVERGTITGAAHALHAQQVQAFNSAVERFLDR